jgi:Protein containing tetrapyrrole methyltransferase domain and MazG-like (predicted pyrophosphatase) domain
MQQESVAAAFLRLVGIMDDLREKCPWDRKQTIHTLRAMTIEETYELADAITENDWKGIKEELGDLLLHILFYSKNRFGAEAIHAGGSHTWHLRKTDQPSPAYLRRCEK